MLDKYDAEKVHQRTLDISIYTVDDERMIVEGELKDNRLHEWYWLDKEKNPPVILHHMVLRLLVRVVDFVIEDLETEMPSYPMEECLETMDMMKPLIGESIAAGFSKRVQDLIGGVRGCEHLKNLLLAMGPAFFQGYWSQYARKPTDMDGLTSGDHFPSGTCWVWREGGAIHQEINETLKNIKKP